MSTRDLRAKLVLEGDNAGLRTTLDDTDERLKGLAGSAGKAGAGIEAAFGVVGVRSAAQIQREINGISSALGELARDGKVSGADFDRAWISGQARIKALKEEIGGVPPKLDTFAGKLNPLAGQLAAAFSVREVALMAAQFDSLTRSLNAISGGDAARELGYITAASNRLGLDLASTSKAYSSWLASVKGSSLEGEQARQVFEAVAGSMAKLGKSSAETEGALTALGQMVGKGTVSMEELRGQLSEHLPGAMKAAADGAGLTVAQLTKMVESGNVLAEDLLPGLAAELKKLYGSGAETQGFVAGWNGVTSAVTEAVGRIGQTEVVTKAVGIAFGATKEVVLVFGTALLTVVEAIGLTTKTWATLTAALRTGEWSMAKDEIVNMANESAARINELASKTLIAKGVQQAFGQAVKQSANEAADAAPRWLAIKSAYTEVSDAAKKFADQVKASAAARVAEQQAVTDIAQLLGTESEKRAAAAKQAEVEAKAKRKLAEAANYEAQVSASNLAAMQVEAEAIAAAGKKISDAKQKEIDDLRESNKLKQESSAKAAAEAESARIRAGAAAVEVKAHEENWQSLQKLKAARDEAAAALKQVTMFENIGIATKKEVRDADQAAAEAARIYRSALQDNISAIQAKGAVERANLTIAEKGRSLQLASIDTQIAVAQARGRDLEVQQLQIERARVEMELSALKAKALRAEADAQLALVAAKRAELEASGQMTEVKRLELAAAEAAAKAKRIDADVADELARRARQLSDVIRVSGGSMDGAAGSADRLADSWSRAAGAGDRLALSADRVKGIGRGSSMGTSVGSLPDGLTADQLRNMGFSNREIEDYQVKQKDAPAGTVNRQVFTSTQDSYTRGIELGLSSEEAKVFAARLSDEVTRANAKARGDAAGVVGIGYSVDQYLAEQRAAETRALEYAKQNTNAKSVGDATQAVGGNFYPTSRTVTVEIKRDGRTTPIQMANQSSADALVRELQALADAKS